MILITADPDLARYALKVGERVPTSPALFSGHVVERSRVSDIGWLWDPELLERVMVYIRQANAGHLDVTELPSLQWTVYPVGGHYDWHTDWNVNDVFCTRKLSVSLNLTPAEDYEGGAFQYHLAGEPATCVMDFGTLIVFPSFVPHRVTPVTRGTRLSLVGWALGPPLK